MIKCMKTLGFDVNNDMFEKHSWYFRNALVRANYNDLKNGIYATNEYLEKFFGNLLMGTEYELRDERFEYDITRLLHSCDNLFSSMKIVVH